MRSGIFKIKLDFQIGMDLCQIVTQVSRVFACFQFYLPAVLNLINILINVVECAIFLEQGNRRLFTDAGYTGDVVRFIAKNILHMKPGYFRLLSDFVLNVTRDGKTTQESGTTLHEIVLFKPVN